MESLKTKSKKQFNPKQGRGRRGKKKEQMRKVKNKQEDSRCKLNHCIKCKLPKHLN